MIYLDSAATSFLKPKSVKRAMINALDTMSSPGRGAYAAAMCAADKVYECRTLACRLFNFDKPENVVFTMNATHALNIAIRTLAQRGSRVVISGYEHNSVTRPLHDMKPKLSLRQESCLIKAALLRRLRIKFIMQLLLCAIMCPTFSALCSRYMRYRSCAGDTEFRL